MVVSIGAISNEQCCRNIAGILSAPLAFFVSRFLRRVATPFSEISIFAISWNGEGPRSGGALAGSSPVKTETNYSFNISAFSFGLTAIFPFAINVPTPLEPFFLFLM